MNNINNKYTIYIDFDGTVTTRDVGDGVFDRFLRKELGKNWHKDLLEEWKSGRLTSQECLLIQSKNSEVTKEEMVNALDNFELREGFTELIEHCRKNGISVEILSDGLDFYINHILKKNGLGDLTVKSNHMHFEGQSMVMEFPFMEFGCGHCGNCKRYHIEKSRANGNKIVYIGDGLSDRFAVKSSDIIFARGDLARHCKRNSIEFTYFPDFHTVLRFIEETNE